MRILLVGNYEPIGSQSMRHYADWMARVLKARGIQVTLVKPPSFFSRLTSHPTLVKYLGYLDQFVIFPPHLRRLAKAHDLVHVLDHSNSMYLHWTDRTPTLITCHDVLAIRAARGEFEQSPTGWSGKLLQAWILSGLRRAPNVVCVSRKSADDLRRLTGNTPSRYRVVPHALNGIYRADIRIPDTLAERLGLVRGQTYFFHVGGNQWYKNRVGVLRIFAQLSKMPEYSTSLLILAGKPFTAEMRSVIQSERLDGRVIEALSLANEDLEALYSNALALLFPSLEEGFGWPILEAQASGCPVVTSCRQPMIDVAGEGAIFVDPTNPAGAARAIAERWKDREGLRRMGFANLERYREDDIVDRYCQLYGEILER